MAKVSFIGLGVMGYPMAGHLAAEGPEVCVYNRSPGKAQSWAARFAGEFAATPREAAAGAEFVMTCVGNDDDLRSVVLGADGAFAGMAPGAVLIDHTTASATVARELAVLAADIVSTRNALAYLVKCQQEAAEEKLKLGLGSCAPNRQKKSRNRSH